MSADKTKPLSSDILGTGSCPTLQELRNWQGLEKINHLKKTPNLETFPSQSFSFEWDLRTDETMHYSRRD